jgi:hypothetical protein
MIKRSVFSALVIVSLLVGVVIPLRVQASSGLSVLGSSAEVNFPASITFNISAQSDRDITDIRLHYRVEHMAFARVTSEVYISFTPARSVTEKWVWDMRKTGGLPPGSSVDYWWTVKDAGANMAQTDVARINIEDGRYKWRSLTSGLLTLNWYSGDDAFAGKLMSVAQQALDGLLKDTGAALKEPVQMYIYASSQDLLGSMIYPQEWTGGVTFAEYGIIAIGIGPGDLEWGSRAITHELTHLVIHQVIFNPYGGLPTWLDEGLAMHAEGAMEVTFAAALSQAEKSHSLISVRSLASPFSAYSNEAVLAYAESDSIVTFLIDKYGQGEMFDLLSTFAQGSSYDEALLKVYGFDMDGLDGLWRTSLKVGSVS